LDERLRAAVARAAERDGVVALLFIDLDRFHTINDGFGHPVGDELLRCIAPRLAATLRPSDTLARFSGDEFVVVREDRADETELLELADRLLAAIAEPVQLSVGSVAVTASIGIATRRGSHADPDDLLRDGDTAMCRAKERTGGRREMFDMSMRARIVDELKLERDLRTALASGQLYLEYQPIVSLPDEQVSGVEALLRWNHPERGIVQPADFVPVAERTGLIVDIGRWVLTEACRQIAAWTAVGAPPWARVAVNTSARQLDHPGFVDDVRRILAESGIDRRRVELEITETALFSKEPATTVATIEALTRLGVGVVLDDFGVGYSSLSYLSRFPLTGLKLDRSFLHQVLAKPDQRAIVEAVAAMARSLGLNLVGEGVETGEQASLLAGLGCDFAQGYFFARPMAAKHVGPWISSWAPQARRAAITSRNNDAWISMGEAAATLGVSASTLRRWTDDGRLAAQRTAGGHRRFSVADLKRAAAAESRMKLNLPEPDNRVFPELGATLDAQGGELIEVVATGLYERSCPGWFRMDRARRPLRQWVDAMSRAFKSGAQDDGLAATARLVRVAEIGGASPLECALFVERFTGALDAITRRSGNTAAAGGRDARRALALVRHAAVTGR
jgi:diguanylate cyclase (GGDEF)-like protein/excisionase family DNA binding protein